MAREPEWPPSSQGSSSGPELLLLRAEMYYEVSHTSKIARQINIFNILQMLVSLTAAVRPNKPNII